MPRTSPQESERELRASMKGAAELKAALDEPAIAAIGADLGQQKRVEAELAESLRLQQLLADLSARFAFWLPAM